MWVCALLGEATRPTCQKWLKTPEWQPVSAQHYAHLRAFMRPSSSEWRRFRDVGLFPPISANAALMGSEASREDAYKSGAARCGAEMGAPLHGDRSLQMDVVYLRCNICVISHAAVVRMGNHGAPGW